MEGSSTDHSSRQFTAKNFYSAKNKKRYCELERNVSKRLKQFKEENLPQPFPMRLLGPCTQWGNFHRQQEAINFCRSKSEELHVFAYESESIGGEGQRMFLAASYPHFWHYYRQLKEGQKHHYEVIPEGAVCKLYFDLEFPVENNRMSNGQEMVNTLIKYVCLWLQQLFKISCSRRDILDLGASTPKKFSRHLIFQLPNAAFRNNVAVGHFVNYIFSHLLDRVQTNGPSKSSSEQTPLIGEGGQTCGNKDNMSTPEGKENGGMSSDVGSETARTSVCEAGASVVSSELPDASAKDILGQFSDEELRSLVVNNKDGNPALFCDLGVYTKNRNFRLYLSSKLGRQHPLVVSAENQFQPDASGTSLPAAPPCLSPAKSSRPQSDQGFLVFLASLVANVQYSSNIRILLMKEEDAPGRKKLSVGGGRCSEINKETKLLEGFQQSPYPEVDSFMTDLVGVEGRGGRIRHWLYFNQAELLIYDIAGYRWCHNIQRQHRSNNIIMVADLRKGVYYQKCHDPDCRAQNFKSPDEPLPSWVLPAHYFDGDSDGEEMNSDGKKKEQEGWKELNDSSGDEACLLAAQAVEGEMRKEEEQGMGKQTEETAKEEDGEKRLPEENQDGWDSDEDLALAAQTLEDSLTR